MENTNSDKISSRRNTDLPDSKKDQEKLKQEEVILDLPEVQDIPGQEHIRVPNMREMQDVTISSADEEAEELLSEINTGPGSVNSREGEIENTAGNRTVKNPKEAGADAAGNDRDNNEEVAERSEASLRKNEDSKKSSRH